MKKQTKDLGQTKLLFAVLGIIFFFLIFLNHQMEVKAQAMTNDVLVDNLIQVQTAESRLVLKEQVNEMNEQLVQRDREQAENEVQMKIEKERNSALNCSTFINNRGVKITPPQWFVNMFEKYNVKDCKKISYMSQVAFYESNYNPKAKNSMSSATGLFQYLTDSWGASWNKWKNEDRTNADAQFQATSLKIDLYGGAEQTRKSAYWEVNKLIKL